MDVLYVVKILHVMVIVQKDVVLLDVLNVHVLYVALLDVLNVRLVMDHVEVQDVLRVVVVV